MTRTTTVAAMSDVAIVEGVAVSPDHLIDGERVSSPTTFEDRSPLDWSWKLADIAAGDAATADAAVTAADAAFPAWAALGPDGRAPYLHRLADLIEAHTEDDRDRRDRRHGDARTSRCGCAWSPAAR